MIRITPEFFRTYRYLRGAWRRWVSAGEIAEAGGFTARTARSHLADLMRDGIVERIDALPVFRYRLAEPEPCHARGLLDRLEQAAVVYDVTQPVGE